MGVQNVNPAGDKRARRKFISHVLNDIKALQYMLDNNMFETGVKRIGAEQEVAIADKAGFPAPIAMDFLDLVDDNNFTTELAKFNFEVNLDPLDFSGNCFSDLHKNLVEYLDYSEEILKGLDARPILVGILPTIKSSDLGMSNLTPLQRYYALAEVLNKQRKGNFKFTLNGIDELITEHPSMMMESCNTSFQLHLQVDPEEFVRKYNWAQAITAPLLACSTNSPMLLGKRVWRETRISLFQQSIDTRSSFDMLRNRGARVTFGSKWLNESILEIFQQEVAHYDMLLGREIEEDSLQALKEGKIPKLQALNIHNGTIYRWNRPCYGVGGGVPHLRIENRVFPSGPTLIDEVANAAFWFGLMMGQPKKYEDVASHMDFDDARDNFTMAARSGMQTQFKWLDGHVWPCQKLINNVLLPMAEIGLKSRGINPKDIDLYLTTIDKRVRSGKTGSQWILDSFAELKKKGTNEEAIVALTAGMYNRQRKGVPVSEWDLANLEEAGEWTNAIGKVSQLMTRDLVSVRQDDMIELVDSLMTWLNIRHVPVEDSKGHLVGLITKKLLDRYKKTVDPKANKMLSIKHIMLKDVITCHPDTATAKAVALMREKEIGALMVVKDKKLRGILTKIEFENVSERLPKEFRPKQ